MHSNLSALNTAEAIVALIQATAKLLAAMPSREESISCGRSRFPMVTTREHGYETSTTPGQQRADVLRTGYLLEALMLARVPVDDPMVTRPVAWLPRSEE